MAQVGFQDYWISGSRVYFQEDDKAGVEQPWIDLGTVETVNPAVEVTKVQLFDPFGGIKKLVSEAVTAIEERYEVRCRNISLRNLSLLLLGSAPEAFTQAAANKALLNWCTPGELLHIHDTDASETSYQALSAVGGIYVAGNTATTTLTAIDAAARKLTVASAAGIVVNEFVIVEGTGLANIKNSRTYTVTEIAGSVLTVAEVPAANETAITGSLRYDTLYTGTSRGIYGQGPVTDAGATVKGWDVVSLDRGFVKIHPKATDLGTLQTAGNLTIAFSLAAIASANRLIKPQSTRGTIEGRMELYYSRAANTQQTVRKARVSITPQGADVKDNEFSSLTFSLRVLSDLTKDIDEEPGGRMVQFLGAVVPNS